VPGGVQKAPHFGFRQEILAAVVDRLLVPFPLHG
jgi:hypothetical protein